MKRKYTILIIALLILSAMGVTIYIWAQRPYMEIEKVVRNLQTEKEVIEVLGKPHKTVHRGSKNYYIKGYSFKNREIDNKVHIYFPDNRTEMVADIILYVYIDKNGRVEDYFVGGS